MNGTGVNMVDWDAASYHRVSAPQLAWAMNLLPRLALSGEESVADAGCGSGRLTMELLRRLPRGHVIAIDQSAAMLEEAARMTQETYGDRVSFLQADIQDLQLQEPVNVIFSTATFHWVPDHARLFRALFHCLKPGGRLIAQCGGGQNISRVRQRAASLLDTAEFHYLSRGWRDPWYFSDPDEAARNLRAAGFTEIETGLEHAPVTFPDAETYGDFLRSAVLPAHLAALPDNGTRERYLAQMISPAASDDPPYSLDYWRLNLLARRPLA